VGAALNERETMKATKAVQGTRVIGCSCPHTFQDDIYGAGRRLHNTGAGVPPTYTCTVCGKDKR